MWTNFNNAEIDNMQHNIKCKLCADKDEIVNHKVNECSKIAQKKCKTRHDWVGKVIYREFCKKLILDHTNKRYMNKQASVLENEIKLSDVLRYKWIT